MNDMKSDNYWLGMCFGAFLGIVIGAVLAIVLGAPPAEKPIEKTNTEIWSGTKGIPTFEDLNNIVDITEDLRKSIALQRKRMDAIEQALVALRQKEVK